MNEQYLKAMRADDKFRSVMIEIGRSKRPIIPRFQPCATMEETQKLLEEIKFQTGQQIGFDLLYLLLTGSSPESNGA